MRWFNVLIAILVYSYRSIHKSTGLKKHIHSLLLHAHLTTWSWSHQPKLFKLGLVALNASVSQDRLGLTGVSPRHHFLYIFSVKITSKESPCGSWESFLLDRITSLLICLHLSTSTYLFQIIFFCFLFCGGFVLKTCIAM